MTTQFFQAAGVIGMASMEYKRDTRSGEFRMVEPTIGRTDYQEEVATLNGVNLPHAAWCSELGLPFPAPCHVRAARRMARAVRGCAVGSRARPAAEPRLSARQSRGRCLVAVA